jgi:hypothetical protein
MADPTNSGQRIETVDDLGSGDAQTFAYWETQEKIAEKEERAWIKRAREIVKRYRDERASDSKNDNRSVSRFNILWSNVQTLKPTLYARTPKPDVQRRFRDQDDTGRLASLLIERCLSYFCDPQHSEYDRAMVAAVEDRLLPGRGVVRVFYEPMYGDKFKPRDQEPTLAPAEDREPEPEPRQDEAEEGERPGNELTIAAPDEGREVVFESVTVRYVFWEDYREGPARQWSEVPWIRYRSYLTRDELVKRFGRKKGKEVELDYTPKGAAETRREEPPPDIFKKAVVHEVWNKATRRVIWYAPSTPDLILDEQDDPLKLVGFFPNPNPLLSTTTNDKRIPVPDYYEYQDQARELDTLTSRIDRLTRALKVSGVYAGEEKQVFQQLIDEGTENRLIPVEDAAAWADKGGIANMIQWMPVQQIAETIIQLYNARDRVKATLYEITGLGDILRGMTNPQETLGAQELKANFATRRIQPQQQDVARFARDLLRLMGGIVAEHFSAKTISLITGYPQLVPVPPLGPRPVPPQPSALAPQMPGPALPAGPPAMAQGAPSMQPPPQGVPGGPPQGAPPGGPPAGVPGPPPGSTVPGAPPQGVPAVPPQLLQAYQMAMQEWQQAQQAQQAVIQGNAQKQQQFAAAVALIKEDGETGFRIDIEADSTIAPDEQAEKQSRVEFLQQMVPLLEQVVPIAMGNPALAAVAREITLFAARGFRVARTLEETLEAAFDAIGGMPKPPQPGQQQRGPSPQELQLQAQDTQAKYAAQQADTQARVAGDQSDTEAKLAMAREKNAVEMQKTAAEERIASMRLAHDSATAQATLALDEQKAEDQKQFRNIRSAGIEARSAEGLK